MKQRSLLIVAFLIVLGFSGISANAEALNNPVVPNGKLGEFRHGTYPSLGDNTHVGVDLVASCGSDIYAFADGKVKDIIHNTTDRNFNTLGYMVIIEHPASLIGKTFYTLYLHMQNPPKVKIGDPVKGGSTIIGEVGRTGKVIGGGCHTHFEIRYFSDLLSKWENIYGPGDQRASKYFTQNWGDPVAFFKKYPTGISTTSETILPKFLGVYALSDGALIELKKHPQSSTARYSVAGADLLKSLSGIRLRDGNIQFIVYRRSAAAQDELVALKIAHVRKQITYAFPGKNRIQDVEEFDAKYWHVMDEGLTLRISPIPQNPDMMIRAVPREPFAPGLWALVVDGDLYDFLIGGESDFESAYCVDRIIANMGVTYTPCNSIRTEGTQQQKEARILLEITEDTEVKSKPALLFTETVTKVTKGTIVEQLDREKDFWYKVKLPSGEIGWILKFNFKAKK